MYIKVKVIQMPGLIKDVEVAPNALVSDAIRAAGASINDGYTVKVNGLDSNVNASLSNGDSIIISQGAKGNK